jgi:hypothetical protein
MYLILYVYIKEYTSPQTMIFKTLLIMSGWKLHTMVYTYILR